MYILSEANKLEFMSNYLYFKKMHDSQGAEVRYIFSKLKACEN